MLLRTGVFLSTPSARRATATDAQAAAAVEISIHALREEGDLYIRSPSNVAKIFLSTPSARRATQSPRARAHVDKDFYPRPPRGGRQQPEKGMRGIFKFLSTPSARRATRRPSRRTTASGNFYPRPPRGGRPSRQNPQAGLRRISIHALREEGDEGYHTHTVALDKFLSTPSARRATGQDDYQNFLM